MDTEQARVNELLAELGKGRPEAGDELFNLFYRALHRLARSRLARESRADTLTPTVLVHEAFLRLTGSPPGDCRDADHFMAIAGSVMRRVLVDHARRRQSLKRGADPLRITLVDDRQQVSGTLSGEELLALDQALSKLENHDAAMARVVELRYFAGLDIDQTAAALAVSPRTVNRLWTAARAWLARALS